MTVNHHELKRIAYLRRLEVLDLVYRGKSGHIGGDFSCMDILVSLYYGVIDVNKVIVGATDRDRFLLSKGHSAEALYAVLAGVGILDPAELMTYGRYGTRLAGHPTKGVPGVEMATGALGHGLPVGVGMALVLKSDSLDSHVYVLMGDGEQAEGSVWEAAMAASKYHLDNLTAIVDRNRLQISGCTEDIMPLGDLAAKYRNFGFKTVICDGHNHEALSTALLFRYTGRPVAVIANTIKGFGASILENDAGCHHMIPSEKQYNSIKADLLQRLKECE